MPRGRLLCVPEHHRHRDEVEGTGRLPCSNEAGVACLSGASFGEHGEGYLRFSYANSLENLEEAVRRMEAFLDRFRKRTGG